MNAANEKQVAGTHYQAKVQHWDWAESLRLPYLPSQVTKYLTRWRKKNGLQDLEKAGHFLEKYIETLRDASVRRANNTNAFLTANEVDYQERSIFAKLMMFEDGQIELLVQASDGIQSLIDHENAKKYTA